MNIKNLIDLVKYPIITDKATKLLELNQYTFAVDVRSNKTNIKQVVSVNTSTPSLKQRRIGKFTGNRTKYKKAVLTLATGNSINLFSEN